MRAFFAFFIFWATSLQAEGLALSGFELCSGPNFESNAIIFYGSERCHDYSACGPFDAEEYRAQVVLSCSKFAMDVCVLGRDPNSCFETLSAALDAKTTEVYATFTDQRILSAIQGSDGNLAKNLASDFALRESADCTIPVLPFRPGQLGLTEQMICAANRAQKGFFLANRIAQQTLELEALEN